MTGDCSMKYSSHGVTDHHHALITNISQANIERWADRLTTETLMVKSSFVHNWSSSTHLTDFEGNIHYGELFSCVPRIELLVPVSVWPWLLELDVIYLMSAWWAGHAWSEEILWADISTTTAKIKKLLLIVVVNIVIDMYHYFIWWNGVSLCECRCLLLTVSMMDNAHKKEQNLMANISTMTKDIEKRPRSVVNNWVGYRLWQVCVKTELFWRRSSILREGATNGRHFLAGL